MYIYIYTDGNILVFTDVYICMYMYVLLSVWYYRPDSIRLNYMHPHGQNSLIPTPEQLFSAIVVVRPHQR